jgi:hypothetical protein
MVQLNLLPDVKKEFLKAQKTKATVISVSIMIVIGSAGLTLFLASVVYVGQQLTIGYIQGKIDERSLELKNVSGIDKYLTLQNQLNSLPGLESQNKEYSRAFDFLKILNPAPPNNINLNSFQVNNLENTMTMAGETSGFEAFSVFEDTLKNAMVSYTQQSGEKQNVKLFVDNGVAVNEQTLSNTEGQEILSFSLTATYNPEVFQPSIKDIKLTIPNIQTTRLLSDSPNVNVFNEGGN